MLLIEGEKAKACAAVTEELASRNREYEEFRAKAAETLTAALARVSTVQKEAQITIAQIQTQADSLAEELRKTRELLDARNEEVQGWKTRFAELEMKREEDAQNSSNLLQINANKVLTLQQELDQANPTKNSEMESLRNHISWLETQLQNLKSGSSHTVEGDPDVTMIDSAGLSSESMEPKDHVSEDCPPFSPPQLTPS